MKIINSFFSSPLWRKRIVNSSYFILLINILIWPIVSYLTSPVFLIISNLFEYLLLFMFLMQVVFDICQEFFLKQYPSIIFLMLYIIFSAVVSALITKITFELIREVAKMVVCLSIFYTSLNTLISKKRITLLLYTTLLSISVMFLSTVAFNIDNMSNIVEAFTGGRYRLGNLENQANAYATFCVLACFSTLFIYYLSKKKYILFLNTIPTVMAFGTQSKKGIIMCILLMFLSIVLFVSTISSKKTRFIAYAIGVLFFFGGLTYLLFYTNTLVRLLSFGSYFDASTSARIEMFRFLLIDSSYTVFMGHGLNTFQSDFFRFSGIPGIFHSTIGDVLYSSGLMGFILWALFILKSLFKNKKENECFYFILVYFIFQILNDLTAQIWNMPILFIFLALFTILSHHNTFTTDNGNIISLHVRDR